MEEGQNQGCTGHRGFYGDNGKENGNYYNGLRVFRHGLKMGVTGPLSLVGIPLLGLFNQNSIGLTSDKLSDWNLNPETKLSILNHKP